MSGAPAASAAPLRPPWRLLAVAVLLIALSSQPLFLLGAAFLRVGGELGFGATGLGGFAAVFFLSAALTSTPLGRIVERVGWRRAVRANAVASGSLLLAIAVFAHSRWLLGTLVLAAGAVYGMANPAANKALAEHIDPRRRALVFGLKHAGIPTSTLLAGLAVPLVVVTVGWRWAFVGASLLTPLVVALVPRDHAAAHPVTGEAPRPGAMTPHQLVALAAGGMFATLSAVALGTYLVAAAVAAGFSESAAGLLLFAGSLASITGRIVVGSLADRRRTAGFLEVALLLGLGAAAFATIPLSRGPVFPVLVLLAFATGWGWPGLLTFTVVNANLGTPAAASGVTQAGVFLGAGAGPLLVGWIADRRSFTEVWLTVAASLLVAAIAIATVGRRVRVPAAGA